MKNEQKIEITAFTDAIKKGVKDSLLADNMKEYVDALPDNNHRWIFFKELKRSIFKKNDQEKLIDIQLVFSYNSFFPATMEYVNKGLQVYRQSSLNEHQETEKHDPDDVYLKILDTKYGQRAGKIALVEFVKEQSGHSTWEKAFKEADEIHRKLTKKHLYKTLNGFEVSKSDFESESENRKILKEILNPLK